MPEIFSRTEPLSSCVIMCMYRNFTIRLVTVHAEMMLFCIPAGENDAVLDSSWRKQCRWIPSGGNDAVLDSSRRKWCSFGLRNPEMMPLCTYSSRRKGCIFRFQKAETMHVDSSRRDAVLDSSKQKWCSFGFQEVEMMQFCIPSSRNDAVLDSRRWKWCSFGFQEAKAMPVDSSRQKWFSFGFQHAEIMQFWIPACRNDAVLNSSWRKQCRWIPSGGN